jgi:CubicO group peptidase (beta-lactamase class C family)
MRARFRSFWLILTVVVMVAAAAILLPPLYRVALLGSGYMAQTLCAGLFVSGRNFEDLMRQDLSGPGLEPLQLFTPIVDDNAKEVRAAVFGLAQQTAIFRNGLGCTLIHSEPASRLREEAAGLFSPLPPADAQAEWPEGTRVVDRRWPDGVDGDAADRAIEAIFSEPNPSRPRNTRALVVVHAGRIVAERYAPGFDAKMPMIGWSMSKTATNLLVGLRVKDGALSLDATQLMPEWRDEGDPRAAITLNELMHMTSGLVFDEDTGDNLSDVSQMLYVQANTAGFAASKPLANAPGTHWFYSTGTTSIIAAVLRQTFDDERSYLRFPRERLFAPLGMRSAVLSPDASGTLVGTSFVYASARDWARLGLLFLRDGMWQGTQLLPKGWVAYSTRPTPLAPGDQYGAQVWLKLPDSPGLGEPPMPDDTFYMLGYDGQVVAMVPSRDLVIVRLGLTRQGGDWEPARDLAPLVNAFPAHP